MNLRRCFLFSLLAIFISAGLSAPPPEHNDEDLPVTELGQWMDRMNSAFRKLRRQADEPTHNASSIELVAAMQEAASQVRDLVPVKTEDLPEAERADFVERYRMEMGKLSMQLAELAAAFRADDNAGALRLIREIGAARKRGHEEFQKDPS